LDRAAMSRLECDPAARGERGFDRNAVECHREIAAPKAVAMHIAIHGGFPAEGLVDFLPIDLLRSRVLAAGCGATDFGAGKSPLPDRDV
jgi:hypothetical protein